MTGPSTATMLSWWIAMSEMDEVLACYDAFVDDQKIEDGAVTFFHPTNAPIPVPPIRTVMLSANEPLPINPDPNAIYLQMADGIIKRMVYLGDWVEIADNDDLSECDDLSIVATACKADVDREILNYLDSI